MSEATSLVQWDRAQFVGAIPDSDWMCPTGPLGTLAEIHQLSGSITDEDIRVFAEGRPQHVELWRYPEGLHAAYIVDANGARLTDTNSIYAYAGPGAPADGGVRQEFIPSARLPVGDGTILANIAQANHASTTNIQPAIHETHDTDAEFRRQRGIHISPSTQRLKFFAATPMSGLDWTTASLRIEQEGPAIEAYLNIVHETPESGRSFITAYFDKRGMVEQISAHKTGLLHAIGVGPVRETHSLVEDARDQRRITAALGEVMGIGSFKGIDLRRTCADLYAAMGQRDLDLTRSLAPRR